MSPPRRRTDKVLLVLLFVLNVASAWTTVIGAREILPRPMSDVIGLGVQAMLFLALAGFAAREATVRKWVVIAVFAFASVYTSFFAYYEHLAGDAVDAGREDRALQAHAAFVSAALQPAQSRAARLDLEAKQLYDLARREGSAGATTGMKGFGPVARKYAAEAREKEMEAAKLRADLTRLDAAFATDPTETAPEDVYARDLAAWQAAPDDWKAAVPAPARADYIDTERDVALLAPILKVKRGELPAIVALALALSVDGIAILLGTAIQSDGKPVIETVSHETARVIERTKDASAAVRAAWHRPGVAPDRVPPRLETAPLEAAAEIVTLRIAGRGSDFLMAFYQSIHPESGAVDFAGLQSHDNATFRIAARMLADRLRRPRVGWLQVREGWWTVPPEHYPDLTAWLGDQVRKAVAEEAQADDVPAFREEERTLELVLPMAA